MYPEEGNMGSVQLSFGVKYYTVGITFTFATRVCFGDAFPSKRTPRKQSACCGGFATFFPEEGARQIIGFWQGLRLTERSHSYAYMYESRTLSTLFS